MNKLESIGQNFYVWTTWHNSNIYIENEFHLDYLFRIYYFMLRNKIPIKDCEDVLKVAHETAKLYQIQSNLKAEIEKLKQTKNNYSLN